MAIPWQKMGRIFVPSGEGFFKTHATRPIPFALGDSTLRIFFSSRDHDDRALPTYIDVDADDPSRVFAVCDRPLVELGEPGTFDDAGVTLVSIVDLGGDCLLYYAGLKRRRQTVSVETAIGVLRWTRPAGTFHRVFQGPILAQDRYHPYLTAAPFVVHEAGRFRMWYCSGTGWRFPNGNPEPIYTVYYAESPDGLDWRPRGKRLIEYAYDGEVVSAPWVLKGRDKYHMWYSARGLATKEEKNYKIGYAESPDGLVWRRMDADAGIPRSQSGWDSEMVCYPAPYLHGDKMYMFYSGNAVGKGGIGYAVAENVLR